MRLITIVLAFACGASVANLYYAQPLLDLISRSFGVGQGAATIVVTLTQIGYALGLALLLPLGDLLENRRFVARTLILTSLALVAAAVAPSLWVFLVASLLVGVTSVVAQVLVPFAAHLAPPETRGKFVGQVMTGLLLGIMLARSAASFAAAAWGWRSIYGISAVLMLGTSFAVMRVLPRRQPEDPPTYGTLLASIGGVVRTEPVLVRRALAQACMFGAFTAFWTAITYQLIDSEHLTQAGIAVFALVGAAGAAAAPIGGRLGDAGYGSVGRIATATLAVAAMVLAGVGASHLYVLAAAGVLLDLAVQGHQIFSQRDIYALRADARARINSVHMTTIFVGGALSSAVTGVVHDRAGWTGVTVFGAILPVIAMLIWAVGWRRERSTAV